MDVNAKIVPVMLEGFTYPADLGEIEEIRTIQAVVYSENYHTESIEKIGRRLQNVNWNNKAKSVTGARSETEVERTENKYFNMERDKRELVRLNNQKRIMKKFDKEVYERIAGSFEELIILDLGSNRGDLIMDRLGKAPNLGKIVGVEYDQATVEEGNKRYGEPGKIQFYQMDLEDADCGDRIEAAMDDMQIEAFNVIHISMLILHLSKPFNLLKTVRKYLAKDGIIVIKDIDDGMNLAYPDEQNEFRRVIEICNGLETAGFRHSGRQIYTLLKRTGYKSVVLEKSGLSTIEMDFDEREALFDTYFSFILEDAEIMKNRHPNSAEAAENYEWFKNNYDSLEEKFQDSNFYFNLGFMLYTARR